MKMPSLSLLVLLCSVSVPACAIAGEVDPKVMDFITTQLRPVAADALVQGAVKQSNAQHAALAEADILDLDAQWRAQVGNADQPVIAAVLQSEAADMLRKLVTGSDGVITEVIVMDSVGLNVAVSDVTSDYWQGDEDKFTKSFGMGPDGIDVSAVELDESTQTYQMQVSIVIPDAETGAPIGAMTIGLNAEAF